MAITAITTITNDQICLDKGADDYLAVSGTLSTDSPPGQWVWFDSANDQWVPGDSDSTGHKTAKMAIIGYRPRIKPSTGAERLITDNYDVSEAEGKTAPIIKSGICAAYITDQGAAVQAGHELMISSTAGSATKYADAATGATSGTARKQAVIGTLASNVANGDTKAVVGIGKAMHRIWGRINA